MIEEKIICKNVTSGKCCGNWNEFGICKLTIPPTTLQPCQAHDKETEKDENIWNKEKVKFNLDHITGKDENSATKFDTGKPSFTSIPQLALLEVAKGFTIGKDKYGQFNYSKPMKLTRYLDALGRHNNQFLCRQDIDESGVHHLALIACNALMALDSILTGKAEDDRNINYK